MKTTLLSIVIPCKNEEKYIGKTLSSLLSQTAVNMQTPIIIADAGSTDDTLNIISNYSHRLNIKVVPGGLPAVGRNKGAAYTHSEYILFLDADVTLGEPTTIQNALDLAQQKNLDLVSSHIHSPNGNIADKMFWHLHGFVSLTKIVGAYAAGMFIMMRSDAFNKLGGFNEHVALGEDWELTHQVAPAKFSINNSYINTTNRRFASQGYLKTFYQYLMVAASQKFRHANHTENFDIHFN
jgi:glycosyltransferase involved in cell wall biosynthesis